MNISEYNGIHETQAAIKIVRISIITHYFNVIETSSCGCSASTGSVAPQSAITDVMTMT